MKAKTSTTEGTEKTCIAEPGCSRNEDSKVFVIVRTLFLIAIGLGHCALFWQTYLITTIAGYVDDWGDGAPRFLPPHRPPILPSMGPESST